MWQTYEKKQISQEVSRVNYRGLYDTGDKPRFKVLRVGGAPRSDAREH